MVGTLSGALGNAVASAGVLRRVDISDVQRDTLGSAAVISGFGSTGNHDGQGCPSMATAAMRPAAGRAAPNWPSIIGAAIARNCGTSR